MNQMALGIQSKSATQKSNAKLIYFHMHEYLKNVLLYIDISLVCNIYLAWND